ncbi:uncharacterized protein LOC129808460 [Phlebotomus papatasi]|uniref:uncharacterized protein LOC129808460 n=1 Tax=Phlebotomus papatasi TaxID=29031 RepID=UPI00248379E7|nr:uncharacterized protein LOC129808460 [Phlebotomus papatasi]
MTDELHRKRPTRDNGQAVVSTAGPGVGGHQSNGRGSGVTSGLADLPRRQRHLKMATWNIFSLTGKHQELKSEAKRFQLDIIGVSSTKQRGIGTVDLKEGWQLFLSGVAPEMSAQACVGILTGSRLLDRVCDVWTHSGRVMGIKIKLQRSSLAVLQVYAPNAPSEYPAFLDEVEEVLNKSTSEADSVVFFGVEDTKRGHKSIIDFVLVPGVDRTIVQDVRVFNSAELSTDHHLLFAKIILDEDPPALPKGKNKVLKCIRWESLKKKDVEEKFVKGIQERFEQIPQSPSDVQAKWACFQSAILASATEACGVKRVNVTNNVKRSSWWGTPRVKEAVSEKKKAYKLYMQGKDSESRGRCVEARMAGKLAVKAAREEAWKKFGEKLELDYKMANKTSWQTVRRLRGKKSNSIQGVTSKEGNLLTKEEEVLNRWKEYFSELLNPQQGTDVDVPTSKGREESSPSESEVLYAISKLKDGKAAGIDDIRPEMLKLMGIVGVNWLTRVIKVAWQSGRAPKDWQVGVIIPIFKKGNKKDCSNYRGISLLSLPGKAYAKVLERRCREIVEPRLGREIYQDSWDEIGSVVEVNMINRSQPRARDFYSMTITGLRP